MCFCAFFFAQEAQAQSSRIYFAGYMGLNTFPEHEFSDSTTPVSGEFKTKNALAFEAALGFRLTRQFRLETEVGYSKTDLDTVTTAAGEFNMAGEVETYSFLLNGYYDFDLDWPVTPYIGGGLGFALHDGEVDDVAGITADESGDDMTFIYNVAGGLKYRVSEDLAFTGGYRYLGSTDITFDQTSFDYSAHEFRIGLEYDLPVNWDTGGN